MYDILLANTSNSEWWECSDPYEIIVGAILTQNTNWHNVSKSIENLKKHNILKPAAILAIDSDTLQKLIKPSGFYKQKAEYLNNVTEWYLTSIQNKDNLIKVKGVGNETADSIMLYALNQPYFVIDSYTHRIMERVGYPKMNYSDLQKEFTDNFNGDYKMYKIYHGLIVEHAKNICQKNPKCDQCCLSSKCERRGVNGII